MSDKTKNQTYQKLHHINSSPAKKTKILNNLIAAAVNLKYNCGIHLSKDDIDEIVQNMVNHDLFDSYKWANIRVSFQCIIDFISEKSEKNNWKIPKIHKFKNNKTSWEINYKKWFALILIFNLKSEFYDSLVIGEIDEYIDYKIHFWNWEKHATNFVKIMDSSNILDTYYCSDWQKDSLVEVNLKSLIDDNSINYFYCFL